MSSLVKFKNEIAKGIEEMPSCWRQGQKVFNYIDARWGVARTVQFKDGIDCFYQDKYIDDFINKAYEYLTPEDN